MKAPEIETAPKRGQYDRALSRRARQDAQRERVLTALAALSANQRELSISNVVELAGIGRNTFCEYFDDVEHALSAIRTRALRELVARADAHLLAARTPLERVRAIVRAWTESLLANPALVALALRPQVDVISDAQHSVLAHYVAEKLTNDRTARSALPGLDNPLKVRAVAAVFDALSRAHFRTNPVSADELQTLLIELAVRLLR
jgi:AcrR family transcriptional regulator